MGCGSPFQSGIVRRKQYSCLCGVLQGGIMNDEECMFCYCLNGGLNLYVLAISTFSFAIVYIKTSRASLSVFRIAPVQTLYGCFNNNLKLNSNPSKVYKNMNKI